jgi:uncharacterized protein (TIGR02996 family)
MTTSERSDDLLRQIYADPMDDTPRSVYADLLEQHDDPRGQLIRLQLKRASLPEWDSQVTELELKTRALLATHDAEWRAGLPKLPGVTWGSFERGFVGKVDFNSLGAFSTHRKACLIATPVHSIVIRWPRSGAKPGKLEAIPGVDELTVVGTSMGKDDLKWLGTSPLLATVRSLNLIDSEARAGLAELLKSPHLSRLTALRVPLHRLGNAAATKLTAATLPSLTELDLSVGEEVEQVSRYSRTPVTTFGSRGALALASWSGLAQLASLDVSGAKLGRKGLTALLESPYTKNLKRLYVRDIADAEWEMDDSLAAFESGPSGTLDVLDVSNNDLDGDGAAALMQSRALAQLKVLVLGRVRSNHFDRVAAASWINSLRMLTCGESALELIIKRSPQRLHTIRVVTEGGTAARDVARGLTSALLPALTSLDLSASSITDPGLRALGRADTMPNLVSLRLAPPTRSTAAYTPEGAAELARSPLGKRLKSLYTGVSELDRLPPLPDITVGVGDYAGPCRLL